MSRVSYVMMHDEGRRRADRGRAQGARRAARDAGQPGRHQARRDPRAGARRQPDHAPPRCSASTRRRSARRRSRWRSTPRRAARGGARVCAPTRAPGSTCCRASPATSARTRPGSSSPRSRTRPTDLTLVVDVGTNAEIVLGNRDRLLAASSPDRPGLRGRPDQRRPARRARAPSSGSASTATTLEPRFRVIGVDAWSDEPDVRRRGRPRPGPASPASAARGSSRSSPSCTSPAVITADGVIDGALAARTPRIVADGRTFSYVLHEPRRRRPAHPSSPRTTSAPSSWPRRRSMPACGCSWTSSDVDTVDEIRLAGAFGSQIDPLHAMVLGLVPDCDLDHVRAPATRPAPAPSSPCCRGAARREIEARRPAGREDRDRGRAALPGALRRGHGHPAPDRRQPEPGAGRDAAAAARDRGSRRGSAAGRRRRRGARGADRAGRDRHGRRPMTETMPTRRSGGREGRRAARLSAQVERTPFLTRTLAPFEVLGDEGLVDHRAQRRHHPPGGRDRVPRRPRGTAPPARRRRRRRRASGCASRAGCAARSSRPARRASSPSTPATRRTTSRSAGCTRSSRRTTARRSCATSTAAGATARSRTSATS